jgi:hypothetical protein
MSTATRGRAVEHAIRKLFREADPPWEAIRGAGSKGEFAEMKPDLVFTRKTHTQLRRAGVKVGVYLQLNDDGSWEVFDVAAVQAKLEKEK